jgi:hypothetical protein
MILKNVNDMPIKQTARWYDPEQYLYEYIYFTVHLVVSFEHSCFSLPSKDQGIHLWAGGAHMMGLLKLCNIDYIT